VRDYKKCGINLDKGSLSCLVDSVPNEVFVEYQKMIDLLYKYNELVKTLNISIVGENSTLDDIKKSRNTRNQLLVKECQYIEQIATKEKNLKEALLGVQKEIDLIDINDLEKMNALSTTMFQLKEQSKKIVHEKEILETIRTEKKEMSKHYDTLFSNFCLYENRLYEIQGKLEELINRMKKQALCLKNIESQIKERNLRKKEGQIEKIFSSIHDSSIRIFYGLSPEIRQSLLQKYSELLYSYSELRQSIFMQALSMAEDVITKYDKRTIKLERIGETDLFTYDIETQLHVVENYVGQLPHLPLEKQRLEALKIIYNMDLIMKQNALQMQIIHGKDLQGSLTSLHELSNRESECRNITQLYKKVKSRQGFSFYTFGSKKISAFAETKTNKTL
jgi:hypothetical protein